MEQQDVKIEGKLNLNEGGNSVFIGLDAGKYDDGNYNGNVFMRANAGQNNISDTSGVLYFCNETAWKTVQLN